MSTSITSYGHCYGLSKVQVINSSFYILVYDWSGWCWFRALRRPEDPFLWSITSLWLFDHIRVVRVGRVIIKTSSLHTTNLKETMSSKNWSYYRAYVCELVKKIYSLWHYVRNKSICFYLPLSKRPRTTLRTFETSLSPLRYPVLHRFCSCT